jgi:uncharacterized repeat protein (TIGR01451 family)
MGGNGWSGRRGARSMVGLLIALLVGASLPVAISTTPAGAGAPVGEDVDLQVETFTDSADPVEVGATFSYTIILSNVLGPAVSSTSLQLQLPAEVSFTSGSGILGGSCSDLGGGLVDCDIPLIEFGSCPSPAQACNLAYITVVADAEATPASATVSIAPGDGYVETNATNDYPDGDTETTTITGAPTDFDLWVDVYDESDPVGVSSAATWSGYVYNYGPGPATDVEMTFSLDAGMTFLSSVGDGTCSESTPGEVTCALGTVPAFSYVYPAISVETPSTTGTVNVTGTVTGGVNELNPADNTDVESTEVVEGDVNLYLYKSSPLYYVGEGQEIPYRIDVYNGCGLVTCSDAATDVVVTDVLPPGTSFVSASASQGTCSEAAGTVSCELGTVAAGGSAIIDLVATAPTGTPGILTNEASVATSSSESITDDNIASADVEITAPEANLVVSKSDDSDPVATGQATGYWITVYNAGPAAAPDVTVVDTLPAGVVLDSADLYYDLFGAGDCVEAAGVLTCEAGTIPAYSYQYVRLDVTAPGTPGEINNTVTATTSLETDPSDNTWVEPTQVFAEDADLYIDVYDLADPIQIGEDTTYQVYAYNDGPLDADDVVVTNTLPAGFSFVSATILNGSGTCGEAAGVVTCDLGTLETFGWRYIDIVATAPGTPGTYTNTATVSSSTTEINPADNTDSEDTEVTDDEADLSVTIYDNLDPAAVGLPHDYDLYVQNGGPASATNTTVTIDLPAGSSLVSASPAQGSCSESAGVVTCDLGTVTIYTSVWIELALTAQPTPGTASLTATVSSDKVDPDPTFDSATETTEVLAHETDLSIGDHYDSHDPVEGGTDYSYWTYVWNNGPAPAYGVELVDTIPAGTTFVSAGTYGGHSCSESAGVVTCDLGMIPAFSTSGWVNVTVTAPGSPGVVTDSVSVSSDATELAPADNTDTEDTEIVIDEADLRLTKWDQVDPVAVGESVVYTIEVDNLGPSDAANTIVTDTLPAGTTFTSAVPTQGSCSESAGTVTCDLGSLAAYTTAYVEIEISAPATTGDITNSASVTSDDTDPNPADNSDDETTGVVVDEADVRLVKSESTDPVPTGDAFTYQLWAYNDSPIATSSVVVTDALPAEVTFQAASSGCVHLAGQVTCTIASLAAYSWAYREITVVAPGTPTVLENTASITSSRPDPDVSDNTVTEYTTVGEPQADLVVDKAGPSLALVGGELTYSMWVTNTGLFPADDVVLADTLPAGSTFVSASVGCSEAGGVVTCPIGDLAVGQWAYRSVTIEAPATAGVITNTATATAVTPDNDPSDSTDSIETNVIDLVADAGDDQAVVVGEAVSFDGGGSSPLAEIDSFSWNFGDTTTTGGQSASHAYTTPGTYTVTLTVTADGETDTDTAVIEVAEVPATPGLEVTVEDTGGSPIPGADVLVIDANGVRYTDLTDGSGIGNLDTLPAGTYTVYAYKQGYLPNLVSGATVAGGTGTAVVVLDAGQFATSELTSRPLTYEEILDAGIDPSDPANQHVYEFEIHLAFQTGTTVLSGFVTSGGFTGSGFAGGDGGNCTTEQCTVGLGDSYVTVTTQWFQTVPILTFMVIPGKAKFLKEFFSVQYEVANLAAPAFTLTGGSAELPLPPGLAFAPTATPQSQVVSLPDIPGGSSATAEWIVRGDEEGFYDLTATYTGTLQPFGTPVTLVAQTGTPLHVWAGSALEMIVDTEDQAFDGYPYRIRIGLKNVADVPVYNPGVELLPGCSNCVYAPGQSLDRSADVILPGDTFWSGDFVVIPNLTGPLDLSSSFVKKTGGDVDLVDTIVSHPALQTPATAPPITATGVVGGVQLDWDPIAGATGYEVYAAPDRFTDFTGPLATVPDTQTDAFVSAVDAQYYAVVPIADAQGVVDMRHQVLLGTPGEDEPTGPVVSIGDSSIVEGNTGKPRIMQLPLVLSEPATAPVTVSYVIRPGTASGAKVDIDELKGATKTVTFKPAIKSGLSPTYKTLNVKITPDLTVEGDEDFTIEILGVTGATLGRSIGTGTIVDDEGAPSPSVAISPAITTIEGDGGAQKVQFRVTLSEPATSDVTVQVDTVGGTLTAGTEYKPLRAKPTSPVKTLKFTAGQWQKVVTVVLYPDTVVEGDETVELSLLNPVGVAILGTGTAIGTILDDD